MGFLSWLTGRAATPAAAPPAKAPLTPQRGMPELARRLKSSEALLGGIKIAYVEFKIPKRNKGLRRILAPVPELKQLQRQILRRVLGGLKPHPSATGFCRGHSIVSNALPHVGKAAVVRMDLKDFFPSTPAERVKLFFKQIGWDEATAALLTRLCTHEKRLPQGAPTSPKLSNLLNYRLDSRLSKLAEALGAAYTRYADDITYSLENDSPSAIRHLMHFTALVVREEGYQVHEREKLYVRRRKDRQVVTGLVVNDHVNLPRNIRRWLRAVEHHQKTGKEISINAEQLEGWRSLQSMIKWQSGNGQEGSQEKPA